MGLELALKRKPVILAGNAHYSGKGFTFDAKNKRDYKNLLNNCYRLSSLTKIQQELAYKYAYCYFIQRQIPISAVKDPQTKWWNFDYKKRDLLIPEKDPIINFICNRIIDGKDFIMDERLVKLSESY